MNKKIKILINGSFPKIGTRLAYYKNFHKKLDLKNPKGINEKLQYLKFNTYYNNPVVTQCVDKYRVKEYLKEKGMENILVKLLNEGYDRPEDLRKDWDKFPDKFVIKCNHGCSYNILVSNKNNENLDEIIKRLNKWMKEDFWRVFGEPQYKFVKKHILVEEYLGDDIKTYKFYCFNGEPKVAYVSFNGENGEKDLYLDYYDMNWNRLDITLGTHLHKKEKTEKPINYDKMIEISRKLSKEFPFVRVDLYNIDGAIYFSELTFIPTGGMMKLKPEKYIDEWGEWLEIPIKK